jgi:hypothetical protein
MCFERNTFRLDGDYYNTLRVPVFWGRDARLLSSRFVQEQ